jgi:hypothetical protein
LNYVAAIYALAAGTNLTVALFSFSRSGKISERLSRTPVRFSRVATGWIEGCHEMRPMPLLTWIAGLMVAGSIGGIAAQWRTTNAVEPGGPGILTKCFDWVVARPCRTYHHIRLPSRITVGDRITLNFGSSPKKYEFYVARIALQGNRCEIFRQTGRNQQHADKINVAPCYRAEAEH